MKIIRIYNKMRILGIETSCDETGVAVYDDYAGLIANQVYSQSVVHANYGGVVPELAARDHTTKIIPLIFSVLKQANISLNDIDGIAYTAGPGLMSALLVGATVANTLAYVQKIPVIGVHHMEAHLLIPMLEEIDIQFPFLALLVSGGHTQLVLAKKIGEYKILGESIDDAVGEVFDKIAVLLGFQYPGGAALSQFASKYGTPNRYKFPRPMINNKSSFNFSFSGLKTFVANIIRSNPNKDMQLYADIAYEFERAIIETLTIKCHRALKKTGLKRLVVSGGVSANNVLRLYLSELMYTLKGNVFYPKFEFCTDNGAMIAYTGLIRLQLGLYSAHNLSITVRPRWSLEELFLK